MYYISAFVQSLSNRTWIVSQKKQLSKAIAYTVILAAVFSVTVIVTFGRMIQQDLNPELKKVVEQIPEFQATVTEGVLRVEHIDQPYQQESITEEDSALFYIDTNPSTTIDIAAITDGYDFSVIVDEEQIQVLQSDGTSDGFFFREADDFELTDTEVKKFIESLAFGKIFFAISLIVFVIMTIVLTIGVVLWTMFFSAFMLVVAKIMKLPVLFIDIVTMGLFARTILFILDLFRLIPVFPQGVVEFLPMIDIFIWVGLMVFVFNEYKKTIQTDVVRDDSHV